jgi:undecaprenyl-diphosphatase
MYKNQSQKMKYVWQSIISGVFTLTLVDSIKKITKVPRPENALVSLSDYAFPSGHSAFAFAIATITINLIYQSEMIKRNKIILSFVILLFAGHTAYRRLIIQVHTPVQVIAGAALGIFVSLVVIKFTKLLSLKGSHLN